MRKYLPIFIFIAYSIILIKVIVFKDIPTIRLGHLILNFGGEYEIHPANFIPFSTILSYLRGDFGWIIAGVNLIGNIAPLVPVGILLYFVWRSITWKGSLAIAILCGLALETTQAVMRVGIFDIDDVILNALGVVIGYFIVKVITWWLRVKNNKNVLSST